MGQFAKDNNLLSEWDEQYQSHELTLLSWRRRLDRRETN